MPTRAKKAPAAKAEPVRYHCPACGRIFALDEPLWRCPCGRSHLNLTPAPGIGPADIDGNHRSLWRYRAALPFDGEPQITLGEGWTPLVRARWQGAGVLYKLEFLMPTGSFKDRGVAVMINYLKARGVAAVINDSSGNGGSSLAGYAAAAGMPCRILVPEHTSRAKVVQMGAYGAEVTPIKGSRQDVAEAALKAAETAFYASHNWQPFFLQGTKTLAYEIWEQLGFRAPDNVVVPVGGGSNLIGCHLGFSELLGRGEIGRLPRLFGVQAAAAAPLHRTFVEGADDLVPTEIGPTIAEGIAMARPVRAREAMAALRASRGRTVAVTEAEIVAALRALARQGVFVEPTSAAAAAGLTQLIDAGDVEDGETTVLVLTGSGLKATEYVGRALGLGAGTR